jgi:plastocyanin
MLRVITVALLALLAVACGGDDEDAASGAPSPGEVEGEQAVPAVVIMEGNAFDPTEFTVVAGQPADITVQNVDPREHTFTVYNDEAFTEAQGSAITLREGDTVTLTDTFAAATYYFRCEIHPATMTVIPPQ